MDMKIPVGFGGFAVALSASRVSLSLYNFLRSVFVCI